MWLKSFFDYLKYERNCSAHTIMGYEKDLDEFKTFFETLDSTLTWGTVDGDIIRNWIVHLMDAGYTATSVNRKLSALRTFYRYTLKRGFMKYNPVKEIRGPRKKRSLPAFIKEEEMNRLLDGDFFGADFEGKRDRLILNMFYATGIRLSELVGLDVNDVDLEGGLLKVLGKRNKERIVPFGDELKILLEDFYSERNNVGLAGIEPLFADEYGERLKNSKVSAIVKKYLGLVTTQKKRSPHVLRHTFATSMLNNNADLEYLKELLGHESVVTTEIYTHTTFEELKKMYNKAHPRA